MKPQPLEAPYEQIREHIRRANAERAVHLAEALSEGILTAARGLARVTSFLGWPRRPVPGRRVLAPR